MSNRTTSISKWIFAAPAFLVASPGAATRGSAPSAAPPRQSSVQQRSQRQPPSVQQRSQRQPPSVVQQRLQRPPSVQQISTRSGSSRQPQVPRPRDRHHPVVGSQPPARSREQPRPQSIHPAAVPIGQAGLPAAKKLRPWSGHKPLSPDEFKSAMEFVRLGYQRYQKDEQRRQNREQPKLYGVAGLPRELLPSVALSESLRKREVRAKTSPPRDRSPARSAGQGSTPPRDPGQGRDVRAR